MRLLLAALLTLPALAQSGVDWPNVGNDKGGTRYSPLTQINRENVANLKPAWTYRVDDADPAKNTTIECTPLVVDGVMYVTTVRTRVVALNPATGAELWSYDPYADEKDGTVKPRNRASGGVNRGLAYWRAADTSRLLVGLSCGRLLSLDPKTHKPDPTFGTNGYVDLREGYANERDLSKLPYGPTSAPAVFENLVFVGCSNGEGHPSAPGDVRAFDVRTGKEAWRFHTIPRPGEEFGDTWENDAWKDRGGANPWGGFTVDAENGILFCATGSAGPDFHGAGRKGDNLFANCVLALDARTGKRLWHFQTVRHDLWDHDNPCPPVVCTMLVDSKPTPVVAQVTKTGYCFILHRKTGVPVFGAKDVPAPASDVPGELAARTQPVPVKPPPFARQGMSEADVTDLSPEARQRVLDKLATLRHDGPYAPPSLNGTVVNPGFHGGATWSGASFDPTTHTLYCNTNEAPYVATLKKFAANDYRLTGYGYFNDGTDTPKLGGQQGGYPAVKPPWGWLNAIDLSKGNFAWRAVLGEFPELAARGIKNTGTENFGGTIVTAGGLVFVAGTKDERFRAFDKATGKVLWEHQLPAGGYATPCTYMVDGRQYVVIAAGGGGKPRTKSGDAFIAFALP
ncbi:MAG: pyrroloquinoline quinone-dependent dehydrogenase [Phycisphaerae bacterium]